MQGNEEFKFDEDLESGEEVEVKKGRIHKSRFFRIVLISLIFATLLTSLWYYFFGAEFIASIKEKREKEKIASMLEVHIANVEPMIVPLDTPSQISQGGTLSFAKVDISMEVRGKANIAAVNARKEKIADIIYEYMRSLRAEDLRGSIGLHRLRREIVLRINTVIAPAKVEGILFKDLIVQ